MSGSKLFLFDHPVSSYAQKVRIALRQKGIPFDSEVPDGLGSGNPIPSLAAANPRLEVPALVDGDFKIFDSKVILNYLEDKYPEKPLLPKDPRSRAEARLIEEVCDAQYEAVNWVIGEVKWSGRATGASADKIIAKVDTQTRELQKWLTGYLGDKKFFNGDSFGYADLVVIPYLNRSWIYGITPAEDSALHQWRARVMEIPSVSQTSEEMRVGAEKMAVSRDAFKAGTGRRREYRDHRLEAMIRSGGFEVVEKGLEENTIRFSWPGEI